MLHRLSREKQAIADYEEALAIQERLAAADSGDVLMRLEAAKLMNTAAPAYEAAGRRGKAIEVLRTAGTRLETLLTEEPENEDTRLHVGWVWCNLGDVYGRTAATGASSAWAAAARCYRRSLTALARMKSKGPEYLNLEKGQVVERAQRGLAMCRRRSP